MFVCCVLITGKQHVCHVGEPDYENLYAYHKHGQIKVGPEMTNIAERGENSYCTVGAHTQGGAMEHLAHVIFGYEDLDTEYQDMNHFCANYLPASECPGSPCIR